MSGPAPRTRPGAGFLAGIACLALGLALPPATAREAGGEEPPIRFGYSIHSTLGNIRLEAATTVPETEEVFVPNRGFSGTRIYVGYGPFRYRFLPEEGEPGPVQSLEVSRSWQGRHIYFFLFRDDSVESGFRLLSLPADPDFEEGGAMVFANYSRKRIAAKLGEEEIGADAGDVFWRAAPDAPEGMRTLLVEVGSDRVRPLYRNRIPIRSEQRLFVFVVPHERGDGLRLLVAFDRRPPGPPPPPEAETDEPDGR